MIALLKGYASVDAFVREQMMAANPNRLAAPRRPFNPQAIVIGHANDTVKRLVGVYRFVRSALEPLKAEMNAASARLDAVMKDAKQGAGIGVLLNALSDPALASQIRAAEAKAEEAEAIRLLLAHVSNLISIELALFCDARGKGEPKIDENWNIVVDPVKPVEDALPQVVQDLLASLRRDGAEVKVVRVQR